ncbi:MPS1 [Enterospora canceri]|uniref:MPS1 n=1 Tax=Enterospora canceri TaxID=1081671 RepID=A0A1Y1S7Q4_9MICR|nr:MPS1 [Enterospora canceri]
MPDSNSQELPSQTDEMFHFLKQVDPKEKEAVYSKALTMLSSDMYSMHIFLNYIDFVLHKEDPEVLEKLYTVHKNKFKAYHAFWKRLIEFSVVNLKKDFDMVLDKVVRYLKANEFIGRDEMMEYFTSNRSKIQNDIKNSRNMSYMALSTPIKSNLNNPSSYKDVETEQESDPIDPDDFYSIFGSAKKNKLNLEVKSSDLGIELARGTETVSIIHDKITGDTQELMDRIVELNSCKTHVTGGSRKFCSKIEHINIQKPVEIENEEESGSTQNTSVSKKSLSFLQDQKHLPIIENTQPLNNSGQIAFNRMNIIYLEKIGKGGFSTVHKVMHNNKIYALKKIFKGDYDKEVQILQKLNRVSDNYAIKMVDYKQNVTEDIIEILFEYAEIDLQNYTNKNAYSNHFIKHIALEMLQIIEFIHTNGVIHKDIKPSNFVFVQGRLKVIDFGISKEMGPDTTSCLNNKEGTFYYSSPEVFLKQKVGRSADIWSFGCIMYYLYYKETVFKHDDMHRLSEITQKEIKYRKTDRNGHQMDERAIDLMKLSLKIDPKERPKADELLKYHPFFIQ